MSDLQEKAPKISRVAVKMLDPNHPVAAKKEKPITKFIRINSRGDKDHVLKTAAKFFTQYGYDVQHAKIEEGMDTIEKGATVHVGHAKKGGAGYTGIVTHVDHKNDKISFRSKEEGKFGHRTWVGKLSNATLVNEETDGRKYKVALTVSHRDLASGDMKDVRFDVNASSPKEAIDKAHQHYRKAGYKVYKDMSFIHSVNFAEEVEQVNEAHIHDKVSDFLKQNGIGSHWVNRNTLRVHNRHVENVQRLMDHVSGGLVGVIGHTDDDEYDSRGYRK